jgi:hypothetical protein
MTTTSTTNYEVWEYRGYGVAYHVASYSSYELAEEDAARRNNYAYASGDLRNGNDDPYFYEVR